MMTKVIHNPEKINCDHLLGTFLGEESYDTIIDSNVDYYGPNFSLTQQDDSEHNILFKLRKNVFSFDFQKSAFAGLYGAAVESQNRGMAAGPKGGKLGSRDWLTDWQGDCLDLLMNPQPRLDGKDPLRVHMEAKKSYREESARGLVWLRKKVLERYNDYDGFFDKWVYEVFTQNEEMRKEMAADLYENCVSVTSYANSVYSGIAGFFDRYPRYPWGRTCSYNDKNPELFAKSFPYIRQLDKEFKKLLPERYAAQKACANRLDSRFLIGGDTVFTTLTINKTFRTAAHRDAGDLGIGYSNLGVVSTGKDFAGGMLVLPEYRVAINIRPGDLLLIANHDAIHGNTPITTCEGSDDISGIERMSIVAYFREKMLELGSFEYEQARADFTNERRVNKEHPMWRPLWNGVSVDQFHSQEWYDFLEARDHGLLEKYHPEALNQETITLETFFA